MQMDRIAPKEVQVLYRSLGRVHVFTSPHLPGLHHAHMDLRKAFDTLPDVVAELVELQYNQCHHYSLDRNFEAFEETLRSTSELPVFKLSVDRAAVHA
jgi:hypothetical protein